VHRRYHAGDKGMAAGEESDSGFTLIELLIVIVVLGILAAVVVFALGSVANKSAVSACNSDAKTVETAIAAYNAQVGSLPATTGALTSTATVGSTTYGPWLQSWPSNSGANYTFSLTSAGVLQVAFTNPTVAAANWTAASCSSAT